ncbi:acrosin-like [Ahaetulla prasina]|uniref:acrosin-like n=1 Tax=Ahaetulla prasina TaxID=499056 RepID=UPI0026475A05|nr:acrosin-like [Ahaetulla prasina]
MKKLLLLLLWAADVLCLIYDDAEDTCTTSVEAIRFIHPSIHPSIFLCRRVCGSRPLAMSHGMLRIVGGVDSLPGTWPWAVSFQFPTREGFRHFCAGSLINSRWVISTAKCFLIQRYLKVEYFRIQIGATQRSKPGPDAQNRVIKRLVDHKQYNQDKHLNNIALVELDKPVICNDYVQPACLPEGDLVIDSLTHCYICGWGITINWKSAPYSDILQEAEVSLVARDACNSSEQYSTLIRQEHLCAVSEDPTKGSCRGDGGGPLMCRESHTERYWLIGLNSWGKGCASGKVPGVFTSTQFFLTWIKDIMANPPASGLSPPFRPTTPRTPSPPPPSRFTGVYYLDPIYKKVNGMLVGYFPEANTYSLPTRQWRPAVRRTTWPWYTGPPRTFAPFTFYPAWWSHPTPTFPTWGKGPSIIYRMPRRKFTAVPHTTHFRWPSPHYWKRPKL